MKGCRVFVGGLSNHVGERDLSKFFRSFGRLHDIVMKTGYCFVEFGNVRDADDAVYKMNGKELIGRRVAVEKARDAPISRDRPRAPISRRYDDNRGGGRLPSRTSYRLIVKNLSSEVSWQKLKYFMRDVGEVNYADAHKYRRNEGVVEFATYADMKNAMRRRDRKELCGRKIKLVYESDSRRSRSRSYSRSRSRSRTCSRNRSHSRSHDRSRSRTRSGRRRSRSNSRSQSRSRSRRCSRSNSRSRRSDKQRSRSRSHSSSRNHASKRSRSDSQLRSRSRSPAPKKTRASRSPSAEVKKSRSERRSAVKATSPKDKKQSQSRSRSPVDQQSQSEQKGRSLSRSRSRSVSRSKTSRDERKRSASSEYL